MIITDEEIKTLERILDSSPPLAILYVLQNIHLLIPSGFDEVRMQQDIYLEQSFSPEKIQKDLKMSILESAKNDDFSCSNYAIQRERFLRLRHVKTGAWFCPDGWTHWARDTFPHMNLIPIPYIESSFIELHIDKILANCKSQSDVPRASALVFPLLWRVPEKVPEIPLCSHSKDLIVQIAKQDKSLSSIKWRELEEIVAELLRSKGMQVKENHLPENTYRLILKDRVALLQWIKLYAESQRIKKSNNKIQPQKKPRS